MRGSDGSYVQDTLVSLLAGVIIAAAFGGFMIYNGSREVGYVTAKVMMPVVPRWGKSTIVYVPAGVLTPHERLEYAFAKVGNQRLPFAERRKADTLEPMASHLK